MGNFSKEIEDKIKELHEMGERIILKLPHVNSSLCAICGSNKNVEFVKITDCNLCEKCNKELADSFKSAMKMDRCDYPEL